MSDPVKPDGAGGTPNTAVKQPWENLGYESFDAYSQAQAAEVEKHRKQAEEKQAMIDRQANELGQLRKAAPPPVTPPATPPQNTPPPNTPPVQDDVTKEAERTLRELAITMPADQTAKVDEALNKAPANIAEMVETDPQSRLVFMRNVLGDEFQLPKPKRSIFDGLLPSPASKPLHEQLQELMNKQNTPAPRPHGTNSAPRTYAERGDNTPPPPSADRYRSALAGGLAGFRAATEKD